MVSYRDEHVLQSPHNSTLLLQISVEQSRSAAKFGEDGDCVRPAALPQLTSANGTDLNMSFGTGVRKS